MSSALSASLDKRDREAKEEGERLMALLLVASEKRKELASTQKVARRALKAKSSSDKDKKDAQIALDGSKFAFVQATDECADLQEQLKEVAEEVAEVLELYERPWVLCFWTMGGGEQVPLVARKTKQTLPLAPGSVAFIGTRLGWNGCSLVVLM